MFIPWITVSSCQTLSLLDSLMGQESCHGVKYLDVSFSHSSEDFRKADFFSYYLTYVFKIHDFQVVAKIH